MVNATEGSGRAESVPAAAPGTRVRVAQLLWILSETLVLLGLGLRGLHVFAQGAAVPSLADAVVSLVFLVIQLALATLGALIVSRRHGNPIGWIFCAAGFTLGMATFTESYAVYSLAAPRTVPGGELAAWLTSLIQGPSLLGFFVFLLLLFPDGKLASPRWRPVAWLASGTIAAITLLDASMPGPLSSFPSVANPLGAEGLESIIDPARVVAYLILVLILLASAVSLVLRFRTSRGVERQQLKWVTGSGAIVAVVFLLGPIIWSIPALAGTFWSVLFALAFATVPVSAGIAILRHNLYDIDVIINRTLVYGSLTAIVSGIYVAVAAGLGTLLEVEGNVALSLLATGLIAVVFAPLRDRIQRAVNRLMYGERDDPYVAISRLGRRLEATLTPEAVLPAVVQTVREAIRIPYAAIELRQNDGYVIAASSGEPVDDPLRLPLVYHSEEVGRLLLTPRTGEQFFGPSDRRLLDDLARQAGIAAHAVRLTHDLQRSRERLVTAREEERRRLRRDLHDGLGPMLAGFSLQIGAIRNLLERDPAAADGLLTELGTEAETAVGSVRRLVYALRPPALDELGLVGAIRSRAVQYTGRTDSNGLDVRVEAAPHLPPLSAATEVAAYWIAQEALMNVVRHARARRCIVRLEVGDDLCVEVTDDGAGMPEERPAGVGLLSMRERAEELGGTCVVERIPTGGTRVLAHLPLPKE